jgi:hypothetical protein
MKTSQTRAACLAVIFLVSVFYLATIRSGQPWGDDFAMYIHEAKNISGGTPLLDTGYIYNPARPDTGPRLYPPVFPTLLVPGYMTGNPENLSPMKIEMILFFIGILVLLWLGLGQELPSLLCIALLAIVGFNPLFWDFKENIVSDIPFTFLLYLTFTLANKVVADTENAGRTRWQIPALGTLVYLCYGTKTIGIVLLPALSILAVIYWKRGGKRVAWAVAFALVPCLVEQKLLGGYLSYAGEFEHSLVAILKTVIENIPVYLWSVANFWENPYAKWVRDLLCVAVTLLAFISYFRRLWSSLRIYEIFVPFYLAVVILWQSPAGFRYLIPILPLYVFYLLDGVNTLTRLLSPRLKAAALVLLAGLIAFSYVAEFENAHFGAFQEGVGKKESVDLFSFIRSHTTPNDVFIFRKPRALALLTGRSASIYPEANTGVVFCTYFNAIGATYLITAPALDDKSYDDFVDRQFSKEETSFSNADFRVLHIVPVNLAQCAEEKMTIAPSAPSVPGRP